MDGSCTFVRFDLRSVIFLRFAARELSCFLLQPLEFVRIVPERSRANRLMAVGVRRLGPLVKARGRRGPQMFISVSLVSLRW